MDCVLPEITQQGVRDRDEGCSVLEGVFINNKRAHLATGSLYGYIINDSTGIDFLENYRVPREKPVVGVVCVLLWAIRGVCRWIIRTLITRCDVSRWKDGKCISNSHIYIHTHVVGISCKLPLLYYNFTLFAVSFEGRSGNSFGSYSTTVRIFPAIGWWTRKEGWFMRSAVFN